MKTAQKVGAILLGYAVFNAVLIITFGKLTSFGWLSNSMGFLLGTSLLLQKHPLTLLLASLTFLGEAVWTIDWLTALLTRWFPFESTTYMFAHDYSFALKIGAMIHPLLFICASFALIKIAPHWRMPTAKQAMIFFAYLGYLFTVGHTLPESLNVNCTQESCIAWLPTFSGYQIFMAFYYIIITAAILYLSARYFGKKSLFKKTITTQ